MKDWMVTAQEESTVEPWDLRKQISSRGTNCCGHCQLRAQNVNVYYWPEPDSDTSCLDLVGNSVHPLDYGATTDYANQTYWGCHEQVSWGATPMFDDATTAILETFLTPPITVKRYFQNPWSPTDCTAHTDNNIGPYKRTKTSTSSIETPSQGASIRARGHSLVAPSSVTKQDSAPVSTVVSEGFTFTSPFVSPQSLVLDQYPSFKARFGRGDFPITPQNSEHCLEKAFTDSGDYYQIYVDFSYLSASEWNCPGTLITSTMLRFNSGELSTIEIGGVSGNTALTKPFDFRDLPCPARSVMERKYYSPEPGQPYRPFLAAPKQKLVEEIASWFTNCDDIEFTGYDPPKTLVPAAAMVTSIDPLTTSTPPAPSPTQDPGARKTAAAANPTAAAAYTVASPKPKETLNTVADPQQGLPDPGLLSSQFRMQQNGHTESDPNTHNIGPQPQQQSGVAGHSGQGVYASTPNQAMLTSIAGSNSEDTQRGAGTGMDSRQQQTTSADRYGGDPMEPAISSNTVNSTQPNYAGGVIDGTTEPADPSKTNTPAQPNHAGHIGGNSAEEKSPGKSSDLVQPNNAGDADGRNGVAKDTSKTGEQAQMSYTYQHNEDPGREAKTSKPTVLGYTNEGLSGYSPLDLSSYQIYITHSALADVPEMSAPVQNQETSPRVNTPAQKSNADGDGDNTKQGPEADMARTPESTTENYKPSHGSPNQMSRVDSALAMAPQKPSPVQNQRPGFQQIDLPLLATPDIEPNSRYMNKPGLAASSLGASQLSDESNVPSHDDSGQMAAPTATESHALVTNLNGINIPAIEPIPGQLITADGGVIKPLSNGVSILGVTLTPGAQATTVAGTRILLASSTLVIGTKSIPFAPDLSKSLTTTVAGQAIVANPKAVENAGSTTIPEGSKAIPSGITVPWDSSSEMIVGSKTFALASSGARSGEATMAVLGAEGPSLTRTDLTSSDTRPSLVGSRAVLSNTGSIPSNSVPPANMTALSSTNAGPSSFDTQSSSTDTAQEQPTTAGGSTPAPTGEAANPKLGFLEKLTMVMITIISFLNQL